MGPVRRKSEPGKADVGAAVAVSLLERMILAGCLRFYLFGRLFLFYLIFFFHSFFSILYSFLFFFFHFFFLFLFLFFFGGLEGPG